MNTYSPTYLSCTCLVLFDFFKHNTFEIKIYHRLTHLCILSLYIQYTGSRVSRPPCLRIEIRRITTNVLNRFLPTTTKTLKFDTPSTFSRAIIIIIIILMVAHADTGRTRIRLILKMIKGRVAIMTE